MTAAQEGSSAGSVVVAGGTGQVGEGIAKAYAEAGWSVVVPTRDVTDDKRELFDRFDTVELVEADVGTVDGATALHARLADAGRSLDAVVASLGGWFSGPELLELDPSTWRDVLAAGLDAHFALARAFAAGVLAAGGVYVMVNGGAAFEPVAGSGPVSVSAAGQLMLARALAAENDDRPGRVLSIVANTPVVTRDRGDGHEGWVTADGIGQLCVAASDGLELETVTRLASRSQLRDLLDR